MNITLLTSTPKPESVVAAAAKLCYSDSSIGEIFKQGNSECHRIITKVLSLGHFSVLEHISITFGIEGVSRALSHQFVRHRLASYSQQSQRYVKFEGERSGFIDIPESFKKTEELKNQWDKVMYNASEEYLIAIEDGVPPEDARLLLPNAAETRLVMTMNARELHHFFSLRCCNRAQWEIRAMAKKMLLLCRSVSPLLFKDAGPTCLTGKCPEGSMSCGKSAEVRRELGNE